MKEFKRLSALVLALIMTFSCTFLPASAQDDISTENSDDLILAVLQSANDDEIAAQLATIGMFRGTANGFELDRAPTRSEAAIMLVRLYGAEESAKSDYEAGKISHPFTDVSAFASPYVAWLYTNGIVNGVSADKFGSGSPCTLANYTVFLLRALGYQDGVDFQYADALNFANAHEISMDGLSGDSFLRGDLAVLTYRALAASLKDGSTYLLDSLLHGGAVKIKKDAVPLYESVRVLYFEHKNTDIVEPMGRWNRVVQNGRNVRYKTADDGTVYDAPPDYFPAWLPDDAALSSMSQFTSRRGSVDWTFQTAQGRISLSVSYSAGGSIGHGFQREDTVPNKQTVMINGSPADFYREDYIYSDHTSAVLAWVNDEDILFMLDALDTNDETLFRIAESLTEQTGDSVHYRLSGIPRGYMTLENYLAYNSGGGVMNGGEGAAFQWLYSPVPVQSPKGTPVTVKVNGTDAQFWSASDTYDYDDDGQFMVNGEAVDIENGIPADLGGVSVTVGNMPSRNSSNVLSWRDTETGMYFQIWGSPSRTELIHMAGNVRETSW